MSSVTYRITKNLNMPDHHNIINRLAKTVYVVLYKTRPSPQHPTGQLTLLVEPGENTVWSCHNKGIAEFHAKENKGMAATWAEAWSLLVKEYGNLDRLEDTLMQRAIDAQAEASQVKPKGATDVPGIQPGTSFNDNINPN